MLVAYHLTYCMLECLSIGYVVCVTLRSWFLLEKYSHVTKRPFHPQTCVPHLVYPHAHTGKKNHLIHNMGGEISSQSTPKPQLQSEQSHIVLLSLLCQRNCASCFCCVVAALMFDGPITENGQESCLSSVIKQPQIIVHKLWGLTLFSCGSCWYLCPFRLKSKSAQRLRRPQIMKPKFPFRRKALV